MTYRVVLAIFVLLAVMPVSALAQQVLPSHVISNSEDWEDVYSVQLFGKLQGISPHFLISDRHGPIMLNGFAKGTSLWIMSSAERPFLVGYGDYAESRGFEAEEFVYPSINLELGRQVPNVNKFIVLDDAYGYNAISVAPYAVKSRSYVLFANSQNIDEVADFLDNRDVEELILYGTLDREVRDALAEFEPEVINFDGDRFLNNIEIVKRYQAMTHSKQAVLTNGEFIEQEIMGGTEPVLFIGSSNVPDVVRDYLAESEIQIGVLIGNELVGAATTIRRQAGISVFVKFAQGGHTNKGAVSQVEALDMFYLPTYNLVLELVGITLNRATGKMEVTLRNPVEQAIYFKGTYTLELEEGGTITTGDDVPQFIGGLETKTFVYDVGNDVSGDVTVDAFVIFGESKNALEKILEARVNLEYIEIADRCEVDMGNIALFQPSRQTFKVSVDNVGPVDCYVDLELTDVRVAGERVTFSTVDPVLIQRGDSRVVRIRTSMEEEDIVDNPTVHVITYFGEREQNLIRQIEADLALEVQRGDIVFYSLLIIIVLLVAFILWRRKQIKERHT